LERCDKDQDEHDENKQRSSRGNHVCGSSLELPKSRDAIADEKCLRSELVDPIGLGDRPEDGQPVLVTTNVRIRPALSNG